MTTPLLSFNLTNYEDHPHEPHWLVFRFASPEIAREFTEELTARKLSFEADDRTEAPFLVGVKKHHREAAVRANYLVLGRHRSPFIADTYLRWGLLTLLGILVILIFCGIYFN